ncbi:MULTISPECIES: (S)-acetoin forming diacetyl reductase [Staphylococcus]|uniref:(S)-acetoin forming diacetyl reductase n=1 Tax=Staphylococcus TaxID=1279 RepID=UPI000CD0725C|nr:MULTISPECIES: (S)-acetoin forming diacetyl reductase [Staphylococcus]MCI2774012.1 (S)-acetoin forming diacetyl reductase [Staphylococcus petrasii]MCJ1655285.1 (S)-acetoin forming diacetyl reductase [Staphylococcus sp. NRL 21/187]MCJ1661117.1 (S)-acetoin forming diacetyl reductase [Staphylococcus sp. NRL 18/288]MCJ1667014.1 (S)-acetoin forming diacetyl reductase [Staphylococcus sp. NRL 19/737]PNZ84804.1 acetoin reductase [Staphylococcus petrasii]
MSNAKKVAVVTGAAQGIGFKIAERLFKDGFSVALVDFNEEGAKKAAASLKAEGQEAVAFKADVSDRENVFNVLRGVVEHFGEFNVLVNNAGLGPMTPIDTVTPEQFSQVIGVNIGGVFWGIQAALEQFEKLGHGGKIINATSQAGVEGNKGLSLYSSTKFAVRGLTQVAARDLAEKGITVNAYAPGIVETPMMEGIAIKLAKENNQPEEWGWKQFTDQITLKRLSKPEDVANVVSFLAGSDSDYITGQTIIVDGGMRFH